MKKRKIGKKTTARKTAAKKLVVKKEKRKTKTDKISDQLADIRHHMESIRHAMNAIKYAQQAMARITDVIIKDYIRHPLKIDGMDRSYHQKLVEEAARNNPEMFDDNWPLGAPK